MSYQVLARKWRPKKFQDVVGQEHITRSLQNALIRQKLGHAYILTGTRGIGKTSVARLLAKALRCENPQSDANACGECMACQDFETQSSMNVLEIDGASNNSVDDIRDLVGNVQYLPTSGKYKVYIIDEVHMLSTSAFNALLKTLEEPPEHAIFILATTEPEKLLGTVLSRCQRFDFRSASTSDLVKHLQNIAKEEGITFESDYLIEQIANCGKGSFRDTLSLMDQVLSFSHDNVITEKTLAVSLGLASSSAIRDLSSFLLTGNLKDCRTCYRQLLHENIAPKNILQSLLNNLFEVIEKIDSPNELYQSQKLQSGSLAEISAPELFWIYEVLAKDSTWALESIDPERVVDILIQKLCLRRDFLGDHVAVEKKKSEVLTQPESAPVVETKSETPTQPEPTPVLEAKPEAPKKVENASEPENKPKSPLTAEDVQREIQKGLQEGLEGKKAEEVNAQPEAPKVEPVEEQAAEPAEEKKEYPKTWDGFLEHLHTLSPATASNLEQGNLISALQFSSENLNVQLGFSQSGKVFLDYIEEKETHEKITKMLSEFFGCPVTNVHLELKYVDQEAKERSNFLSKAEIKQKEEDDLVKQKEEDLRNNPLLQEAEGLFNTKIDKVVIPK